MQYDNTIHEPRKNWWQRNWKWFVPTGCLSLLVIFSIVVYGIFTMVTSVIKESTPYTEALQKVVTDSSVIEQLGEPIEQSGMLQGTISISNDDGEADLQIPLKGSKSKATLHVVAYKKNDQWHYETITVLVETTQEKINLINK